MAKQSRPAPRAVVIKTPTSPQYYERKEDWQDEYYCNYTSDGKVLLYCDYDTKEVVVREGTEVICDKAFYGSKIESISLPKSLKAIGYEAFKDCCYLNKVVVTGERPMIGKNAFDGCVSLKEVVLPVKPTGKVTGKFGNASVWTQQQKDFLDNVWFFIEKAALYIWKYPEVAMAKIPLESGTSITGGFRPTLGAMVRWWMFSDLGNVMTPDGMERDYALCTISTSLLSGANHCLAVDRQGNRKYVSIHSVHDYLWELCAIRKEFEDKYPDVEPMEFSEAVRFLKEKTSHEHAVAEDFDAPTERMTSIVPLL